MLAFQTIICPYIQSCLEKHIMTWMFVPLKLIDVQLSWDSWNAAVTPNVRKFLHWDIYQMFHMGYFCGLFHPINVQTNISGMHYVSLRQGSVNEKKRMLSINEINYISPNPVVINLLCQIHKKGLKTIQSFCSFK